MNSNGNIDNKESKGTVITEDNNLSNVDNTQINTNQNKEQEDSNLSENNVEEKKSLPLRKKNSKAKRRKRRKLNREDFYFTLLDFRGLETEETFKRYLYKVSEYYDKRVFYYFMLH